MTMQLLLPACRRSRMTVNQALPAATTKVIHTHTSGAVPSVVLSAGYSCVCIDMVRYIAQKLVVNEEMWFQ
jgi:hypothetical protein